MARLLYVRKWSERAIISLVMQTVDNSLTLAGARSRIGRWRLTTRQDESSPAPTYMPVAQDVVRRLAAAHRWHPGRQRLREPRHGPDRALRRRLHDRRDATTGVIDGYHRVFGYPGLHIVDGSAITANLGVNPSLTITAQAERAMAMWPNKGDADPRPVQGEAYVRVAPVAPRRPMVPRRRRERSGSPSSRRPEGCVPSADVAWEPVRVR